MATQTKSKTPAEKKRGRPPKNSSSNPENTAKKPRRTSKPESAGGSAPRKASDKPVDASSRLLWGIILLVLGVLSLVSMIPNDSDVTINYLFGFLRITHKGLVGSGWWLCGFVYCHTGFRLVRHKNQPVRFRSFLKLLLPFLWGTMVHAMLNGDTYPFSMTSIAILFNTGSCRFSGGVLGGLAVQPLMGFMGQFFTFLLMFFLLVCDLLLLARTNPAQLYGRLESYLDETREKGGILYFLQDRGFFGGYDQEPDDGFTPREKPVPEPEPEPETETETTPQQHKPTPVSELLNNIARKKKTQEYDIPFDDGDEQSVFPPVHDDGQQVFPSAHDPVDMRGLAMEAHEENEDNQMTFLGKAGKAVSKMKLPKSHKAPPLPLDDEGETSFPESEHPMPPEPLLKKEKFTADTQIQHDLVKAASSDTTVYVPPSLELLRPDSLNLGQDMVRGTKEQAETRQLLMETISSFGISGRIVDATRGPSVTRYEFELDRGIKLSKITGLSRDIALSLGAVSVRIAPITGKNSVVGIEVPNKHTSAVSIRSVLESSEFQNAKSSVSFAVGKDISNRSVVGDIGRMPHLLIAGTTGSGKSVCTNSMIISLLYKSSPKDVRLIMIDPKMVELSIYNGIPHLLIPVVTDPKKAAGALQWAVFEMMQRYQDFANHSVRDIASYNELMKHNPELGEPKPKIVVFIDELADLMIAAAKEVEESICRVAQMGRAAGIHLVIATQRPSSDVITGLMKANIPSRIALAVASAVDSRIILDSSGAEDLVGNGDMLFSPLGLPKRRVQGCYISDKEVNDVIKDIKLNCGTAEYSEDVAKMVDENARRNEKGNKNASALNVAPPDNYGESNDNDHDPLFYDAVDIVVEMQMASASTLQRKLKVGYSRAGRLVDEMEEFGYVGPFEGSKPRKVLITKEQWSEKKAVLTGGAGLNPDLELAKRMSEAADREEAPPFDL